MSGEAAFVIWTVEFVNWSAIANCCVAKAVEYGSSADIAVGRLTMDFFGSAAGET